MTQTQHLDFPEELKSKARVFFKSGAEKSYSLNYDYAIELYLDGLSFWPDALEEGHLKLREVSQRRQVSGGKKSGFGDGSKYKKGSNKNPKDAMLKAEYLLSKNPNNTDHMMDLIKAAVSGDYVQTAKWMSDILFDLNLKSVKPSFSIYNFLRENYAKIEEYVSALKACQVALQLKPNDKTLLLAQSDLSVQATMEKGGYDKERDFRDSAKDRDEQATLQKQEDLVVKSDDVRTEILSQARQDYEASPTVPGLINKLVDVLCESEKPDDEKEAIEILEKAFEQTQQFGFQQRRGEIRIRQLSRRARRYRSASKDAPGNAESKAKAQEAARRLLGAELDHYKLCFENYPTDMGIKFEYGKRVFQAKKFEEAIPIFQQSRTDPRFRVRSLHYIGLCFFHTEWYPESIASFGEALEAVSNKEDDTGKELRYNLGRAHEAQGQIEEALDQYRKIAQIDYNYRDVKIRVETLRKIKKENQKNTP